MLRPEDIELLNSHLRPSGVSGAWKAMQREIEEPCASWFVPAPEDVGFSIRVANDRESRARAYRLGYAVYHDKGYVAARAEDLLVEPYDSQPRTFTVLASTEGEKDAGTATLVFDSADGLPSEEIYRAEVARLRENGCRLVEATRLAIREDYRNSKLLLARLLNFIFLYARCVEGCTDLVCAVNPRHVPFYVRLLKFEELGPQKVCGRVQGAPAVLLRLDLGVYAREVQRVHAPPSCNAHRRDRSAYSNFMPSGEERTVADFLKMQVRTMSESDLRYFGLLQERTAGAAR